MSNYLTNEANVISGIRAVMKQLDQLAFQNEVLYAQQWEAYIRDIVAPAEASSFTNLEEKRLELNAEFDRSRSELMAQKRHHDAFCAQHQLPYSDKWNQLLADLQPYLVSLSAVSSAK